MAKGSSVTIQYMRTVEFSLALGCIWAAWTAGGDMYLVAPALVAGLIFAIIGIGTIPYLSRSIKLGSIGTFTIIYFGIGAFLHWHFQPMVASVSGSPAPQTSQTIIKSDAEPRIDGPLISTIGRTFFRCPLPPVPTDRTREQILSDMKERIQAARETFGVSLKVNELSNGRQIIMEPITDDAKLQMSGATRWTFEMRKSGPDLLITSILDFAEPLGILGKLRMDPKSAQTMLEHRYIEEMFHLPSGQCQML
jgi:hypothetical protein